MPSGVPRSAKSRLHNQPVGGRRPFPYSVLPAAGMNLRPFFARDGDRTHLGPRSLSPATRFVVDHAPCPVLLVWPETPSAITTIPPAPPAGRTGQIRSADGTCGTTGILALI